MHVQSQIRIQLEIQGTHPKAPYLAIALCAGAGWGNVSDGTDVFDEEEQSQKDERAVFSRIGAEGDALREVW